MDHGSTRAQVLRRPLGGRLSLRLHEPIRIHPADPAGVAPRRHGAGGRVRVVQGRRVGPAVAAGAQHHHQHGSRASLGSRDAEGGSPPVASHDRSVPPRDLALRGPIPGPAGAAPPGGISNRAPRVGLPLQTERLNSSTVSPMSRMIRRSVPGGTSPPWNETTVLRPSAADFATLQQLGQHSSYLLEHGFSGLSLYWKRTARKGNKKTPSIRLMVATSKSIGDYP